MSVISALAAVLLVAVQPPLPLQKAPMLYDKPATPAPGGPGRRAVGTPATVEQMRREQKSLLDKLESDMRQKQMSAQFGEADIAASAADAERRTRVGLALAMSDAEKAEELLVVVASLLDHERSTARRLSAGLSRDSEYFPARFHRLAGQVRLMEAVGADPGVLRKLRDHQLVVATAATKSLVDRRDGGTMADWQAAVEFLARYGAVAAAAAAPADRPAAHARNVAALKEWEEYAGLRAEGRLARQSNLHAATYWRAEAELRELEAAGKADPARVTALRHGVRDAAKRSIDSESPRRAGGAFQEADVLAFSACQARLFQAELVLAAGPEERRVLLKRNLAEATETEEFCERRSQGGLGRREHALRAACDRVEAEVQFLTAK